MNKVSVADDILWKRRIGAVSWNEERELGVFEYDSEFIDANKIEPSPFKMKKRKGQFSFAAESRETFKGLPGMLADSLPDKFGNALIDAWLSKNGRSQSDFSPIERLCYIGTRGMGGLEFEPATSELKQESGKDIVLEEMVNLASKILSDRERLNEKISANDEETEEAMKKLLIVGSSAGGARAKCLIAYNQKTGEIKSGQIECPDGFDYYLLKLDGVAKNKDKDILSDPKGFGRLEFAYYNMATDCKIEMSECQLIEENDRAHFLTKRFDRVNGNKLHMQSLCGLQHYDFNMAGAYTYEQAMKTIRELVQNGTKKALEQQFRRAIFNVVARNQDDHTKNIAFLMNKSGDWSLSPAFDVIYSFNPKGLWTNKHQMQINGKRDDFESDDFIELGKKADLSERKVKGIIERTTEVVSKWENYFEQAKVPGSLIDGVRGNLRLNLVDWK
ncbi:MAG: type II toxin-antitoxin system HipA family toxin [Bdellovibrionales bacterium]|nr:type II toxin-antitoxin system HipA family toxin [Bdellovibrionales bacterium]